MLLRKFLLHLLLEEATDFGLDVADHGGEGVCFAHLARLFEINDYIDRDFIENYENMGDY